MFGPRALIRLATLIAILASPALHAHGIIPAGLDVLFADASGPSVIATSRGLAIRTQDQRWQYVCPSAWGGPDTPLSATTSDRVWIVSFTGLREITPSGALGDVAEARIDMLSTRSITALGDTIIALVTNGAQVDILAHREGTTETIGTLPQGTSHVAVMNGLAVATWMEEDTLVMRRFAADGTVESEQRIEATGGQSPILVPAGSRLFVRLLEAGTYRLTELTEDSHVDRVTSDEPILGPVADGDTVYAGIARQISRLEGDVFVPVESEISISCLLDAPGVGPSACVLPNIVALADGTATGALAFDLLLLSAPDMSGLDESAAFGCDLEWTDLLLDAGFGVDGLDGDDGTDAVDATDAADESDSTDENDGTGAPAADDSGCSTVLSAPQGFPTVCLLGLAMLMGWRRRTQLTG